MLSQTEICLLVGCLSLRKDPEAEQVAPTEHILTFPRWNRQTSTRMPPQSRMAGAYRTAGHTFCANLNPLAKTTLRMNERSQSEGMEYGVGFCHGKPKSPRMFLCFYFFTSWKYGCCPHKRRTYRVRSHSPQLPYSSLWSPYPRT